MISYFNDTNEEGQLALWRWEEHVVFAIHANESISIDQLLHSPHEWEPHKAALDCPRSSSECLL